MVLQITVVKGHSNLFASTMGPSLWRQEQLLSKAAGGLANSFPAMDDMARTVEYRRHA
jgi:hypothetical protein